MHNWLWRMYRAHGHSYLRMCGLVAVAEVMLALTPIATYVTARCVGLTLGQWAVSIAVAEPLVALAVAIAILVSRTEIRLLTEWSAGNRDGISAKDVATAAHALPRRLFVSAALVAFCTAQPAGVITTLDQVGRLNPGNFTLLDIGGFFFSLWGIVLLWVWGELAMRPILTDTSAADEAADVHPGGHWGVSLRLSIGLGSAILVGACYGSALTTNPGQAFEGLWRLIGVTMGVSVAFGLAFVPLFSWQLLEPVRVLRRGTQSVGLGDLSTRLPVITRDEFGELTASFNHMVVGLRERAELRVNNANLVRELQASRERIVTAADAARRRVERDLHDGAQQQLVMARLKVRMLRRDLADLAVIPERIEEIETEIDRALIELRELAHGIYPAQLDDDGLAGAFEYAVTRAAIRCEFECDSIGRYSAELEAALYFSGIEALQNASKYAGPNATAQLRLHESADAVVLTVSDDGAGFDAALPAPRSGLQNIADRVGALGGHVTIQSSPGRGTTVCARIPLMHADEGHCEPRSAE